MSTFAYYNYQFAKIVTQPVQGNLFERMVPPASPDESFARKQAILSELLAADSDGSQKIIFVRGRGGRTHLHCHLVPFADDVAVLKISNRRVRRVETIDFREEERSEYPACIVVRPGVQRIVIKKRAPAFSNVSQVQQILQATLRRLLRPYGLSISIDQLHTRAAFWSVANDRRQYPLGFRRITFRLPHLNLERLRKVMGSYLVAARESFDSDLTWSQTAAEGGQLNLDEHDPHQAALINVLMEDVGGNGVISLQPNGRGQKTVHVGRENYRLAELDPRVQAEAMNEIKAFTKRYID